MSWANAIHLLGGICDGRLWRTFLDVFDEAEERGRNEYFDSKRTQNESARGVCRNGCDVDFGAGPVRLKTLSLCWANHTMLRALPQAKLYFSSSVQSIMRAVAAA